MIIKPCPFCGGKIVIRHDSWRDQYYWYCLNCGAIGRNCQTKEEADEAANMRYIKGVNDGN